ncbi:YesK family protein [Pseudobacillus badius]|uniref:YesK family protein n=1 Tax=Bacillus badius TaxID=1455 RepID=UPI000AA426E5|nr:YesK family protein [Bacillus badius]TDV96879.1 YesK-like protein [Bacillus badius]
MILLPFLVAVVIGIVVLLVTWWFKKMNFSLFVRLIPGVLTIAAAVILFYIGFVNSRGFEGAAYGILAFFLMIFAIASFVMAKARK